MEDTVLLALERKFSQAEKNYAFNLGCAVTERNPENEKYFVLTEECVINSETGWEEDYDHFLYACVLFLSSC